MKELILKYIEGVKQSKLSQNTIEAYSRDLYSFSRFLEERKENPLEIDYVTVMAYMQKLQRDGKANTSTIRNLVSIRRFYKDLIKNKVIKEDPTARYQMPKNKRNIPEILTVEEVDLLLESPDTNSFKGIRDKCMLEVMYATGIKITELLSLTIYDINLKLSYIICRNSRKKERIIPLGTYAVRCLEKYLSLREGRKEYVSELLFFNMQGKSMTRQGFWKIIKQYAFCSGIRKNINSYTLRHSFAVHLLENGADIKSVQELLGHDGMAATQIYLSISRKNKVAEVYKKAHPRA